MLIRLFCFKIFLVACVATLDMKGMKSFQLSIATIMTRADPESTFYLLPALGNELVHNKSTFLPSLLFWLIRVSQIKSSEPISSPCFALPILPSRASEQHTYQNNHDTGFDMNSLERWYLIDFDFIQSSGLFFAQTLRHVQQRFVVLHFRFRTTQFRR